MTEHIENSGELPQSLIDHNRTTRKFFDFLPSNLTESVADTFGMSRRELVNTYFNDDFNPIAFMETEIGRTFVNASNRRGGDAFTRTLEKMEHHLRETSHLTEPAIKYVLSNYRNYQMQGVSQDRTSHLQELLGLNSPLDQIVTGGIHDAEEAIHIEANLYRDHARFNTAVYTVYETLFGDDIEDTEMEENKPSDEMPAIDNIPSEIGGAETSKPLKPDPYKIPSLSVWHAAYTKKHSIEP